MSPHQLVDRAKAVLARERARRPWLDHAARAWRRYSDVQGNQAAGAVTYFSFLSFFPMVALGFAVLGYLARVYPQGSAEAMTVLRDYLPGLVGGGRNQIDVARIADAAGTVTVLGLAGLLYSGLGWVDALREALRAVWGTREPQRDVVTRKLLDVLVLAALGIAVLASVAVTSLATSATETALRWLGLGSSPMAGVLLRALAVAVALAADVLLLLVLFDRLPGRRTRWRNLLRGALLGAVLLEVLKLGGTLLLARTTSNPVYGTFAVVVGLLLWLNLLSRVLLISAAWTVTLPSGRFGARAAAAQELEPVAPVRPRVEPAQREPAQGSGARAGRLA